MSSEVNKNEFATTTTALHLQAKLNDDKTAQAIDRLLDRIDVLENAVVKLSTALEQGPGLMAMTLDMADEEYRKAAERGVVIEDRMKTALQIAEKLTAPETVEKLDGLLKLAEQGPGLMAMTLDMADEEYRKAAARGVVVEDRIKTALEMAEKLTAPEMVEKIESLLKLADQAPGLIAMAGDVVDEELRKWNAKNIDYKPTLELLEVAAVSVKEARGMKHAKVGGIFSMIKTMRDPDRQKALGYLMDILKVFGQKCKKI